eukprot:SAG31_NODE_1053_length_10144_cov_117.540866_4_plen_71_part_00
MFADDQNRLVLFTVTEVQAGRQLFWDYGDAYWGGRTASPLPVPHIDEPDIRAATGAEPSCGDYNELDELD